MGELNREKKLMDKSWIPLRLLENTDNMQYFGQWDDIIANIDQVLAKCHFYMCCPLTHQTILMLRIKVNTVALSFEKRKKLYL